MKKNRKKSPKNKEGENLSWQDNKKSSRSWLNTIIIPSFLCSSSSQVLKYLDRITSMFLITSSQGKFQTGFFENAFEKALSRTFWNSTQLPASAAGRKHPQLKTQVGATPTLGLVGTPLADQEMKVSYLLSSPTSESQGNDGSNWNHNVVAIATKRPHPNFYFMDCIKSLSIGNESVSFTESVRQDFLSSYW